jgi:hypothetical protein
VDKETPEMHCNEVLPVSNEPGNEIVDEIKIESSEDVEVLNGFNVILIKKRVLQFVKQVNPEVSLEVEAKEISQKMSEIAEIDAAVDVVEPF